MPLHLLEQMKNHQIHGHYVCSNEEYKWDGVEIIHSFIVNEFRIVLGLRTNLTVGNPLHKEHRNRRPFPQWK